jgi:hypothetical protein
MTKKMLEPTATLVQYGLAYGVGVPIFVLYRIGRRLRKGPQPPVNPRQP